MRPTSPRLSPSTGAADRFGGFKESERAHLALGLSCSVAGCFGVFTRRTLGMRDAGVGFSAVARCGGCEESVRANLARGGGTDCVGMFARRTWDFRRSSNDVGSGSGIGSDFSQGDKKYCDHGQGFRLSHWDSFRFTEPYSCIIQLLAYLDRTKYMV